MFVVCKSFNNVSHKLSLIIYLAEYWSGKYIIYFISISLGISEKCAYSIKLVLPYIRAFKEEVSFLLRYSRQDLITRL